MRGSSVATWQREGDVAALLHAACTRRELDWCDLAGSFASLQLAGRFLRLRFKKKL